MKKFIARVGALALAVLAPIAASAHEVYVLTPAEIQKDIATPPFSMVDVLMADLHRFFFWAFIGILTVFIIFWASFIRKLENWVLPTLGRLRQYAPVVSRVTIGLSFLAGAYYQATYGPELPLAASWGMLSPLITAVLVISGLCIIVGFLTRLAALAGLALFTAAVYMHGMYMLTYLSYLGEFIVLLLLGSHRLSVEVGHGKGTVAQTAPRGFSGIGANITSTFAPYSFSILRVCFGISFVFSSIYAKFLHNNLALDVANGTGLLPSIAPHALTVAQLLHFEPHFLVLGACIVEVVIGMFFILGIEIRFTALFIEFWLALSLWYFGETVWPHLILFGIPIAFILYGYDKYSLEGMLFKDPKRQPVF